MHWDLTISGFIVGLLIGLTGMGGGLVMTPMMILLFGVNPTVAVGSDLLYASITKIFGAWQHWRQRTVDWKVVKMLSTGSVPGALAGVLTMMTLQHFYAHTVESITSRMLGGVYLLVSIVMIWRIFRHPTKPRDSEAVQPKRNKIMLLGLIAGYIVGLTSVGSGTLFMAGLVLLYPVRSALLIGTDIVQAVIVTGVSGLAHLAIGNVNVPLVGQLLLGSIPGILIGSSLTTKVPDRALRFCLLTIICLTGIQMLMR